MKVAYVTEYDARDVKKWSGTGYFIAESLRNQLLDLECLGPLKDKLTYRLIRKSKRHCYELLGKKYMKDPEPFILKGFAKEIADKLSNCNADIVFSATSNPIAYLDCNQPLVFWADATFANIVDFYPSYSNLCQETVNNWHRMEQLALQKSRLAIYSSDWAAKAAINYYGADKSKVKVVSFGANLQHKFSFNEVKDLIESRPSDQCKLLFLGVEWFRKGGDIALNVAMELNKAGLNTELTIVGCKPFTKKPLPNFVKPLGFISKYTDQGRAKISQLIADSHFLLLPSLADCTPIVLCEANSLGVPCITTNVGGIPTVIRDNINGMKFPINSDISQYCDYIANLFSNYSSYKYLALSSLKEYEKRLNWNVSAKEIHKLMTSL